MEEGAPWENKPVDASWRVGGKGVLLEKPGDVRPEVFTGVGSETVVEGVRNEHRLPVFGGFPSGRGIPLEEELVVFQDGIVIVLPENAEHPGPERPDRQEGGKKTGVEPVDDVLRVTAAAQE